MNGGITYRDMDERKMAIAENAVLRDLLIQAGQVISALQPNRPSGGILDRIESQLGLKIHSR